MVAVTICSDFRAPQNKVSHCFHCKVRKITSNKEGHYIMIKGSIQEEDKTIVNIYAPKIGEPQ